CVQTIVPTRTSVTRTGPFGVAITVEAARQIGQFGGPLGVRELILTTPSICTVPLTISYAVFCLKKKTRYSNTYSCPLYVSVSVTARRSVQARETTSFWEIAEAR